MNKAKESSPLYIKFVAHEILEGIRYLHLNWIMHRDLKPGNVLLMESGKVKLGLWLWSQSRSSTSKFDGCHAWVRVRRHGGNGRQERIPPFHSLSLGFLPFPSPPTFSRLVFLLSLDSPPPPQPRSSAFSSPR